MTPLPCPFCGKEPEVIPDNPAREGDAWAAVRCVNAKCATYDSTRGYGVRVDDSALTADSRGTAAYKRLATRRWNRRAHIKSGDGS